MAQAAVATRFTADDFLAWDSAQTVRHEYLRGEVFAMAGAGEAHVTLALNIAMALRQHLGGTPCRTFITDMKLRVEAADAFFYPDVMVTCSAADAADSLVKREPTLIVEVLSPSTAAFDRGEKFAAYRLLPTLREVLLIDPATRRSDLYRLGADGLWVLHPTGPDEGVTLQSVGVAIGESALWAEVPPATAASEQAQEDGRVAPPVVRERPR
ncbi:MAG: Uma2 family endonuclease [Burkholderiales bacterium]|nr:Uma2 family endonuclease [Burkholderiales bacterium]